MTSRVMDVGNLDRIEFLKGPASLMSGEGASGGAVNFVTRQPHRGKPQHDQGALHSAHGGFVQPLTRCQSQPAAAINTLP